MWNGCENIFSLFSQNVSWIMKVQSKKGPGEIFEHMQHSMSRANLNKSEKLMTNTSEASKYIPKRPRICILKSPLSDQNLLIKSTSKCECCEVRNSFWKFHDERSERENFNWCRFWASYYVLWCIGSICHQLFTFI